MEDRAKFLCFLFFSSPVDAILSLFFHSVLLYMYDSGELILSLCCRVISPLFYKLLCRNISGLNELWRCEDKGHFMHTDFALRDLLLRISSELTFHSLIICLKWWTLCWLMFSVFISVAALNASLRTRSRQLNEIQTAHLRDQQEKTKWTWSGFDSDSSAACAQ